MILFSSWAPQTKVQRLKLFTGKWIKDSFALILLLHKRSDFLCPEELENKAFLQPTNWTKISMASFNMAIKKNILKIVALCYISLRDFPLCRLTPTFVWNLHIWSQIKKTVNLNNLACEGLEGFFLNKNWLMSWYVNVLTNVPLSALCSSVWLIQQHSPQPAKSLVLLLHVFGLAGMD